VRRALTPVLESTSNHVTKTVDLDRSGVRTQEVLKVHFRRKDGSAGKPLYSINLFLTTSLLLVNGPTPSKYEADIHPILEELIQKCTNLDEINQEIEQMCRLQVAALEQQKTSNKATAYGNRASLSHSSAAPARPSQSPLTGKAPTPSLQKEHQTATQQKYVTATRTLGPATSF
jgi:hypothetical protein